MKNLDFQLLSKENYPKEDFVGIYVFYNSKYFYVGQSVHVKARIKEHKSRLKKSKHENIIAQRVYDKYHEIDPFKFKYLLQCDPNDLDYFEIFCFNKIKEKYPDKTPMNIDPVGTGCNTKESRKKMSETRKGNSAPWKYVKYVQLDLEGNLIKIWDSIIVAEKELGIHIHKEKHSCGGFQWQKYDEWLKNPKGKVQHKHHIYTTVKQFTLDGKFIKEWDSPKKASEGTGTGYSSLVGCLNNKHKTAGEYLWSYTFTPPEYNNSKPRHNKKKVLEQYDINGNFIKICKSINSAAVEMGVTPYEIKRCISGHIDSINNYIWKYQN